MIITFRFFVGDQLAMVVVLLPNKATLAEGVWRWTQFGKAWQFNCSAESVAETQTNFIAVVDRLLLAAPVVGTHTFTIGEGDSQDATLLALRGLLPAPRKYLLMNPGAAFAGLCDGEPAGEVRNVVFRLKDADSALPRGLRSAHCDAVVQAPVPLLVSDAVVSCDFDGPPPHYWPVTRITLTNMSEQLLAQLQHLAQDQALQPLSIDCLSGAGVHPFQRDKGMSVLIEGQPLTLQVGPSHMDNGQCFGGNFLTTLLDNQPFILCGHCPIDARFTPEPMLDVLRQSVQRGNPMVVKVDTAWLRVGHIDEIISFPCTGVALIASPALFCSLVPTRVLSPQQMALNAAIQRKLNVLQAFLETELRLRVARIPVLFKDYTGGGPGHHAATDGGNAVNCIYVGSFSLHSRSAHAAVNDNVCNTMREFAYEALLVDTLAANDQGGAGGNVHCLTWTSHRAPEKK